MNNDKHFETEVRKICKRFDEPPNRTKAIKLRQIAFDLRKKHKQTSIKEYHE